jgi:putative nucleotidyltransferase with HDIG domain
MRNSPIPKEIVTIIETLEKAGFQAYMVGGCTRDLFLGRKPIDWDITTNARPEQILHLFSKTFYENEFGTVGVVNEDSQDETLKIVEVTPYRTESVYTDRRHPDQVRFSDKIEDDLKRRDFTINAVAVSLSKGSIKDIIDLYGGFADIKDKVIRTVGNPAERFAEDALRLLRAVRLSSELGFMINLETKRAIISNADLLKEISQERVRDEFIKMIMSPEPKKTLDLCHELGILKYIIPELEKGIGIEQNKAHTFDVWEHLLRTVQHSADKKLPLELRITALLHDIAKPETRRFSRETGQFTFYGHEVVGSRETQKILERLKFPRKTVEKVTKLVRWHMFFSDTETITLSAVRRMIVNVGEENIWDLVNIRMCDRIGTGRPKESPYRLRKYESMIEEALHDPISVGMLKIDGNRIMEISKTNAGPKIGWLLNTLLEEVLEKPELNTKEYLEKRALELINLPENELRKLADIGKKVREEKEAENIKEIQKKYHVS